MKTLVVYYSFEGNTDYAARRIAEKLQADLLRLKAENEPPRNILKFIVGVKSVRRAEKARLHRFSQDPAEYDRIILGSPVWAGRMTPAIREFVLAHPFEKKEVGLFACSASGEASAMLQHLKGLIGGNQVIATARLRSPLKNPEKADQDIDEFCSKLHR